MASLRAVESALKKYIAEFYDDLNAGKPNRYDLQDFGKFIEDNYLKCVVGSGEPLTDDASPKPEHIPLSCYAEVSRWQDSVDKLFKGSSGQKYRRKYKDLRGKDNTWKILAALQKMSKPWLIKRRVQIPLRAFAVSGEIKPKGLRTCRDLPEEKSFYANGVAYDLTKIQYKNCANKVMRRLLGRKRKGNITWDFIAVRRFDQTGLTGGVKVAYTAHVCGYQLYMRDEPQVVFEGGSLKYVDFVLDPKYLEKAFLTCDEYSDLQPLTDQEIRAKVILAADIYISNSVRNLRDVRSTWRVDRVAISLKAGIDMTKDNETAVNKDVTVTVRNSKNEVYFLIYKIDIFTGDLVFVKKAWSLRP